jgi:hypothetical protein
MDWIRETYPYDNEAQKDIEQFEFILGLMNQPVSFFGESVHSVADSVARLLPNGGEYYSDDAATLPPTTTAIKTI